MSRRGELRGRASCCGNAPEGEAFQGGGGEDAGPQAAVVWQAEREVRAVAILGKPLERKVCPL